MKRDRTLALAAPIGIAASLAAAWAPFLLFAAASFETPVEITSVPPRLWPSGTLAPYRSAILDHGLAHYLVNSFVVAAVTTIVTLALAAPAAYALARLRFTGRRALLASTLAAAMFPQIAVAGPIWRMLRALALLNERSGLVVAHVSLALPLAIWLLASFFRELPAELEEAALVDGCTRVTALRRVIAPLAAPGVFTAAILVFVYSWNEFFFALLVLTDPVKQTLPIGIALFPGQFTMPWGEIAAASVVATLPLLLVVMPLERRIVHGLLAGALKG